MAHFLTGIETAAAKASMQRQKLVWNVIRPGVHYVHVGTRGVLWALAFLVGGLGAIGACTGQVLSAALLRTASYIVPLVATGCLLMRVLMRVLRVLVWPTWWLLNRISRHLSVAGQGVAYLIIAATLFFWVGGIVFTLGFLALRHPLLLLGIVLGTFGILAICVGLSFCVAYAAERWLAPTVYHGVVRPVWKGTTVGADVVSEGTVGFGKVMLLGFKAVKSNTCPRIEVEE